MSISGGTSNQGRRHTGTRVDLPQSSSADFLPSQIFLTGLALQLISFFISTMLSLCFLLRVRIHAPHVWNPSPIPVWWRHWRTLSTAMCLSCIGILIRLFPSQFHTSRADLGFMASDSYCIDPVCVP